MLAQERSPYGTQREHVQTRFQRYVSESADASNSIQIGASRLRSYEEDEGRSNPRIRCSVPSSHGNSVRNERYGPEDIAKPHGCEATVGHLCFRQDDSFL